ncbi:hypothetical protein PQX77_005964 [Marasmius sp. AFHP31]|nr:hypothetical protein PQX77_005964 [Marasmius sp. AFHP31]
MNSTTASFPGVKGHIQPHVSNLPRRRPKRAPADNRVTKAVDRGQTVSSSSDNASGKQSAPTSTNKTNYPTDSPFPETSPFPEPFPAPQLPSQSTSFSSRDSSSQNNAPSRFDPDEYVVTRETTPSLPHSLALALPKPKGPVQPHAHHMPRRKRCQLSPGEQKKRWRQMWEEGLHTEEVIHGTGVYVAFDAIGMDDLALRKDRREGNADEDDHERMKRLERADFAEEVETRNLQSFRRVVKVVRSPETGDVHGIEDDGTTLELSISRDCEQDDGIPCVSTAQLARVATLLQEQHRSELPEADDKEKKARVLITVPRIRATDAIALAIIACRSFGLLSIPFTNASMPVSRAPTRPTSPIALFSHRSDFPLYLLPPVLPADPLSRDGALQLPALTLLARMHDLEDLAEPWRGALSSSGVELVNEVIMNI